MKKHLASFALLSILLVNAVGNLDGNTLRNQQLTPSGPGILARDWVHSVQGMTPDSLTRWPGGRPIGSYLTPDGRVDIEAIRASGYQGSMDLTGFDVGIDRNLRAPIIRQKGIESSLIEPDDMYWIEGSCLAGLNGTVTSLTVYEDKLIAGGDFTVAGCSVVNYIASWDGMSWAPLGSGMNGRVSALIVYNGKLIAGGDFSMAGGVEADNIASWDGAILRLSTFENKRGDHSETELFHG